MGVGVSYRLRVNPIACTAHGLCAELLPEIIQLDPCGYPILLSPTIPGSVMDHAQRTADARPALALLTDKVTANHR
jgi:ferredoxin